MIVEHARGMRYERKGDEYILAQVGLEDGHPLMALIHLRDGNRWSPAYEVNDHTNITEREFRHITGCDEHFYHKK